MAVGHAKASDLSGAAASPPAPPRKPATTRPRGSIQQLLYKLRQFPKTSRAARPLPKKHKSQPRKFPKKLFGNAEKILDTSGGSLIKGGKQKVLASKGGKKKEISGKAKKPLDTSGGSLIERKQAKGGKRKKQKKQKTA